VPPILKDYSLRHQGGLFFKIGATSYSVGCSYFEFCRPSLLFMSESDNINHQRNNNLIVLKENGNSFRISIGQIKQMWYGKLKEQEECRT